MGFISEVKSAIINKFLKDEEVTTNIKTHFSGVLKEEVKTVLLDEEIAQQIVEYGDSLFDRYKQKAMGTIGGLQKGVNNALGGGNSQSALMPLIEGVAGGGGDLDLTSIIKMGLGMMMNNNGKQQPNNNNGTIGVMS